MREIKTAESTGFLIGRIAHLLKTRVQEFLETAGIALSAEEISILTAMAHEDSPRRISVLAELLGRDATTLSRQLGGLERAGHVQRIRDPEDGRAVNVAVTDSGRKLVVKTLPLTLALRERTMRDVSRKDEQVILRVLKQMLANLKEQEERTETGSSD